MQDYINWFNSVQQASANAYNANQSKLNAVKRQGIEERDRIAQREIEDTAAANTATSARVNAGALAQARRRAGGTTYRRRGSGVSANQLVSGLGARNAGALAEQRRRQAAQSEAARLKQTQDEINNTAYAMSMGPAFRVY